MGGASGKFPAREKVPVFQKNMKVRKKERKGNEKIKRQCGEENVCGARSAGCKKNCHLRCDDLTETGKGRSTWCVASALIIG